MPVRPMRIALPLLALLGLASGPVASADSLPQDESAARRYGPAFFAEYRPQNALDMVRQVPGFRIDDGAGGRGLGGRPGNVLLDGRQPNAKQDSVSSQLQRIPASRVEAIELIRSGASGLDVESGRPIVNVRLVPGAARAWAWSTTIEQDLDDGGPTPSARISMVEDRGDLLLRAGLATAISYVGNRAREQRFRDGILAERHRDKEEFDRRSIEFNLNATRVFDADRVLAAYFELDVSDRENADRSLRASVPDGGIDGRNNRRELDGDTQQARWEIGADFDWSPAPGWNGRWIGLYRHDDSADFDRFRFGPEGADPSEIRQSDTEALAREAILRSEWAHLGIDNHAPQLDLEVAWNELQNTLKLFVDETGELVPVDVPGGNTRVEELRVNGRILDRITLGTLVVEPALAAEHSVIRQAGPGGLEREFTFLKPALNLVHAPRASLRNRLRIERTVAQLDFNQFASSADFNDEELDFGNPELAPQQTWIAEFEHERRFGEVAVVTLRAFHHWIDDVQDRLPIRPPSGLPFDVPGNIGDGRRWGVALVGTLPLESIGFDAARLDLNAQWEDSRVIDPVTGGSRTLSGQRPYRLEASLRQDLAAAGWAWGVESDYAGPAREFGVDDLTERQDGVDLEAFVETTRFAGVKLRLLAQNLLDRPFDRDRSRWIGERTPTAPSSFEARRLKRDRSVLLTVSGTF